ncbi:GPI-anchored CFEM domain protein [Colletotrichum siamense]|nr:GPI-anchored CFEM domain protein [Colletotrichum siamense]KAI8160416.1 GPI-anchored CFEM domain protein [Colletotrichum sp. SAR 10_71]KAI8172136.1 GPI-anchored CFEM domain protein [Colletotrichum sp. SAR 10_65]KAI8174318.1 GPI-anchored CFEM domain protein [Colletotrichum sp. SAR 10_70]KAI8179796.1 GPI-anchored CFEM domain protein [Colletotrichum sp. SAR 10_75]KAI8199036.1 GPI-anchored CFEM domain protein [Colletotrichum sp. SAR 10_76]KAI8224705.1 GPI-anchored CFEM domain protein [Colletotr
MKYSVKYVGSGLLLASFVVAQGNDLPECGTKCIESMLGKAQSLGCVADDKACLCRNVDFTYGIRDCSYQSCGDDAIAKQAIDYGVEICRQAGVAITATPEATVTKPTGTETVVASPVVSSVFSVITSGGSTFSTLIGETTIAPSVGTGGGQTVVPSPVSTSTFTTVVTSGESTFTTTGETTLLGVGGVPGATGLPQPSVTAPVVSTITNGDSTILSTVGPTTILTGETDITTAPSEVSETASATATQQETQSETGSAASASSTGLAPKQTAGSAVGILAAAGLAAMLI